jgi:hypothetical protein
MIPGHQSVADDVREPLFCLCHMACIEPNSSDVNCQFSGQATMHDARWLDWLTHELLILLGKFLGRPTDLLLLLLLLWLLLRLLWRLGLRLRRVGLKAPQHCDCLWR